jgi:hypothetical protein
MPSSRVFRGQRFIAPGIAWNTGYSGFTPSNATGQVGAGDRGRRLEPNPERGNRKQGLPQRLPLDLARSPAIAPPRSLPWRIL